MPASPTIAAIRSAVATEIRKAMNAGVPGNVLTVHEYRRFWRDAQKFASLFKRQSPDLLPGKINGWIVFRSRTREVETEERWRFYQLHRFEMHGYMGVQDADATSDEKAFQDQVELIRDNLRLNTGVFGNMERTVPVVQAETVSDPVEIGDVTCWYTLLSLEAEAIETKTLA